MEYYNGFVFYLDENNPKWKEYYNNLGKKTFGVYSVAQYFTKKLKELADDKLDKVFNIESSYINQLSDNSLHLSEKAISNWKDIYSDLLQQGDVCVIAIPGYLWKGTPQTSYSFMTKVAKKEVTLSDVLTIPEYAELVEKLFILRFGKKPQDCTTDTVEFFIPALQCAISEHFVAFDSEDKTQTKKENTLQAPAQPVVNETVVEGYFYKRSTGQADSKNKTYNGTSKKVYSVEEFKSSYTTNDCIDLNCEYDDFRYICYVVMKECTTTNLDEYKAVAFTSKNHSDATKTAWKSLMASGYSSVEDKTNLLDSTKTAAANLARRAVIYVLEGDDDITDGAEFWDGTDFIAWGLETTPQGVKKHAKFRQYKFIEISSSIYNSYKNNYSSSIRYGEDGHTSDMTHTPAETHTHKDGKIHYNIPAEVFKNNLTTAGDFQYDTDVSTTYGLTATLSAGESIFWKLSKTKTL